jgi:preprotein translocase subunit SecA
VANVFERVLRVGEGRILRQLSQVVKAVNHLEDDFAALSDDELKE